MAPNAWIRKRWMTLAQVGVAVLLAGFFALALMRPEKTGFLPGPLISGHHQIGVKCEACHTPFKGVTQEACTGCHAEALKLHGDAHPEKKFLDPRNADLLFRINALQCVTCHSEHRPTRTDAAGVTIPRDYCFNCHTGVEKELPSHKKYVSDFKTCSTSGCHNYHENRALYRDFLVRRLEDPETMPTPAVPSRDWAEKHRAETSPPSRALVPGDADLPSSPIVTAEWATTAHAKGGVSCTQCHEAGASAGAPGRAVQRVELKACATCHKEEAKGFLAGKHGMRLAAGLSPMTPGNARLPMKGAAAHSELSCTSCHSAHRFDTREAAVNSCLSCHDDRHSLRYKDSAHFMLWGKELRGEAPKNSGVSCATCHLPRIEHEDEGGSTRILVQHDQNDNLRPSSKMARNVCLNCHGMSFTLDALADRALIEKNFSGRPSVHVETMDITRASKAAKDAEQKALDDQLKAKAEGPPSGD